MGQRQDRRHERDKTGLGRCNSRRGADLQWDNTARSGEAKSRIKNLAADVKVMSRCFVVFGVSIPQDQKEMIWTNIQLQSPMIAGQRVRSRVMGPLLRASSKSTGEATSPIGLESLPAPTPIKSPRTGRGQMGTLSRCLMSCVVGSKTHD
jgi:hypothetical protein